MWKRPGRSTMRGLFAVLLCLTFCSCGDGGGGGSGGSGVGGYVADHRVATDATLRAIPDSYIDAARRNFHVAYFHTSHGSHVSFGVFGLPGFKAGDSTRFAVTRNAATPNPDRLDFHDYYSTGTPFPDLSTADADWAAWRSQVRTYLNANTDINVMLWSWCDISTHDVNQYLASMQTLIDEFGPGGSAGRPNPVTFIFMTGHATAGNNTGAGRPRDQAAIITDYCDRHGYYCIDYYSIDTHAIDGTYYEDAGDDGDSATYGGHFYADWQASHALGSDWYNNLSAPGGSVTYGDHNNQHITSNRKAFAFWWVLARMAGYQQ